MDHNSYKKVLVLGVTFADNTANGVTLTNLFKDWPKEKILAAADSVDKDFCDKERPCAAYYSFNNQYDNLSQGVKRSSPKGIKKVVHSVLHYMAAKIGRIDLQKETRLTKGFLQFIDDNKPNVIYTALGSLHEVNFILKLIRLRPIPLIIHVYDDWPVARFNGRWFKSFWHRVYDKKFREIVQLASVRLTICDAMAEEYEKRYGYEFLGFHNPVDVKEWNVAVPVEEGRKRKSILYMGKVNYSTLPTLLDLVKASFQLNIDVDIVSLHITEEVLDAFSNYHNAHLQLSNYPHSYLPVLLKSHDFLFLPIGFDKDSISYYRYSMLTKLAEYLVTKVPIILYCPIEIALYKYCVEHNCVYPCKEGVENLYNAISILNDDKSLCSRIAENAYKLAVDKHSTVYVLSLIHI